ncbi:hypothetical protein Goarm_022222 [Gossypium armourianum]|uniref:Uncharacterized protein n=1 Tax=Gossypium armourianum TaxID=34283 RepID=A0A7J9KH43_9ROSI|nr:hypothetical protein [Gossypium armourianum]
MVITSQWLSQGYHVPFRKQFLFRKVPMSHSRETALWLYAQCHQNGREKEKTTVYNSICTLVPPAPNMVVKDKAKGLWVSASRGPALNQEDFDEEQEVASPTVPDDVKEGYFTVFVVKGKEAQRYVIELDNLTNPGFLSLLELAREEYGFQQKGVLCLPCRPQELQDILQLWKLA